MTTIRNVMRAGGLLACMALLPLMAHAAAPTQTLFERIGGEAKLRAVVEEFMLIVESDDRINFTFAETDLKKFKQLLYEQLCELTHGPCKYTGRDMQTSHKKLKATNAQFNALAEDLYIAFERKRVPYRLQNEVMVMLAPMERDIVK